MGVVKQLKATVEAEKNVWIRAKGLEVFEKGIRALSDAEVQKMSVEWLAAVSM